MAHTFYRSQARHRKPLRVQCSVLDTPSASQTTHHEARATDCTKKIKKKRRKKKKNAENKTKEEPKNKAGKTKTKQQR